MGALDKPVSAPVVKIPAGMVEDGVIGEIQGMIRAPEIAARELCLNLGDGAK